MSETNVVHLSDDQFEDEVLRSERPVVVDFWATWCGPCQQLAPLFEALAAELPQIKFCKIDIDQNPAQAQRLGIMSIPTLLLYKNGDLVGRQVGSLNRADLAQFVKTLL